MLTENQFTPNEGDKTTLNREPCFVLNKHTEVKLLAFSCCVREHLC